MRSTATPVVVELATTLNQRHARRGTDGVIPDENVLTLCSWHTHHGWTPLIHGQARRRRRRSDMAWVILAALILGLVVEAALSRRCAWCCQARPTLEHFFDQHNEGRG